MNYFKMKKILRKWKEDECENEVYQAVKWSSVREKKYSPSENNFKQD